MIRVGDVDFTFASDDELKRWANCKGAPPIISAITDALFRSEGIAQLAAQQAREIRKVLGKYIKEIRAKSGMSVNDFCVRAGFTRQTLNNLEEGIKVPSDLILMKAFAVWGWKYPGMPNFTSSYPVREWFKETAAYPAIVVDKIEPHP